MSVRREKKYGTWFYRKWVRTPDGHKVRIFGTPKTDGLPETRAGAEEAERRAITRVLNTGEPKKLAFIKKEGKDKGYAEITNKKSQFTDRDLYLVVYGLDGVVRAHGANEKMVAKNLIDLKDVDGKPFVKERTELGKANATFWQDYKFSNPVSKKIEPKQMYCERLEDTVVRGGVYKI